MPRLQTDHPTSLGVLLDPRVHIQTHQRVFITHHRGAMSSTTPISTKMNFLLPLQILDPLGMTDQTWIITHNKDPTEKMDPDPLDLLKRNQGQDPLVHPLDLLDPLERDQGPDPLAHPLDLLDHLVQGQDPLVRPLDPQGHPLDLMDPPVQGVTVELPQ